VLLSGGQDSTTCLAWALSRFERVETLGFLYGQRHAVEIDVRQAIFSEIRTHFPTWAERLGTDRVVPIDVFKFVTESALTSGAEFKQTSDGLPSTFVPGRNIIFLTLAAIVARQRNIKYLVAGTCETDFSGYPDCRDDTIKAVQVAVNLGMQSRLVIETPLMWIDKAATWGLASQLGGRLLLDIIIEHTHTCYLGDRSLRHPWGYGCGSCDACKLRSRGWDGFSLTQGLAGE
jgi:7-cyano-7-deazaguanine synthase